MSFLSHCSNCANTLKRLALGGERCLLCSGPVLRDETCDPDMRHAMQAGLCPECAEQLVPRTTGYCPLCGECYADPTPEPYLCGVCREKGQPWDGVAFWGTYDGLLKQLMVGYKFSSSLGHGCLLQRLLSMAVHQDIVNVPDMIVPVPLHPKRLSWRGYNQSQELAEGIGRQAPKESPYRTVPVLPDALLRKRHTPPQSSLSGPERLVNLQGAFEVDHETVSGRSILLVDDVMTTGATLAECAGALKEAGAVRVELAVLVRA